MLPIQEQSEEAVTDAQRVGELLTGDLGLVVLRALLENGAGYIVSSWHDRPTPIDAAIDDARERVLGPRGVVLRRLRALSALEPLIADPTGGITAAPPRGAVVFAGRRGMRPSLEQFLMIQAAGSVVGFCFDEDALQIEDALVIDPEPTAIGIVRAIDQAFEASARAARPALIVIRARALGMRGTIRRRAEIAPAAAASGDAERRSVEARWTIAEAAGQAGLITATLGARRGLSKQVLVVSGPMERATQRSLALIAEHLQAVGAAGLAEDIAIVSLRVAGVIPDRDDVIGQLVHSAGSTLVLGARAQRIATRLDASQACSLDPGSVRGEQIVQATASWMLSFVDEELAGARAVLQALSEADARDELRPSSVRTRLPRRNEVLHRAVSPTVAAALTLAQGVIGVPTRVDAAYPTYRTDTGVLLSIVPAGVFAAHGIASAAPGAAAGVFVVTGSAGGVMEMAGAAGASIEHVDGSSPRSIGAAIGRACQSPRSTAHVVVVTDVQRVAAPRTVAFGMDPDLVGTERLATAAVPTAATALVDLGDELCAGPTVLALDRAPTHAALDSVRELSPATWDLRSPHRAGAMSRASWKLHRQLVRIAARVDL